MVRTGAIVFTWGTPVRGREAQALDVFSDTLQYYEELSKEGRIIAHREYFRTSDPGGMMIIEGLLDELSTLLTEDAFRRRVARASSIVEDLTIELCVGGSDQTVQQEMTAFVEELQGLGYV